MIDRPVVCDKFGGSVFQGYEGFRQAADYLSEQFKEGCMPVAVVSAPNGVSNRLIEVLRSPDTVRGQYVHGLRDELHDRYTGIIEELTDGRHRKHAMRDIGQELARMESALDEHGEGCFLALGENHSGLLLKHALRARGYGSSEYMDGYKAGVSVSRKGAVDVEQSVKNIRRQLCGMMDDRSIHVIGGYVGRRGKRGRYVLMGRNTTDVTGALVSVAAETKDYEVIKDVPGIYRVEPEFCQTGIIPRLSYNEALQITGRGARVVHPHAITIAQRQRMPIKVKNMEKDSFTLISDRTGTTAEHPVAAISAGRFYVINISDDIMNTLEGRGYLAAVAAALSKMGLDIYDAAMPASTISITVPFQEYETGRSGDELRKRLRKGGFSPTISGREVGGISLTGEAMKRRPGTLSCLAGILGRGGISVVMGSQSDEAVLSPAINLYVNPDALPAAVQALCKELF